MRKKFVYVKRDPECVVKRLEPRRERVMIVKKKKAKPCNFVYQRKKKDPYAQWNKKWRRCIENPRYGLLQELAHEIEHPDYDHEASPIIMLYVGLLANALLEVEPEILQCLREEVAVLEQEGHYGTASAYLLRHYDEMKMDARKRAGLRRVIGLG